MSNVMGLELSAPGQPPTPAYRNVRSASRLFEMLFTTLLVAFGVLLAFVIAIMLAYTGDHLRVTPHSFELTLNEPMHPNERVFGLLPLGVKLAYIVAAIVRAIPVLGIFVSLRNLFGLYAKGVVFAPENSAHLKRVGLWLVAAAFAPFICHLFLSALGAEIDKVWFHTLAIQELVLGGLVFVIAQVMQVGREIEEDRSQFV